MESAALALASSRYLDHRARQTGDADLFKQAAALAQTARQHELAAWELAAREAAARPVDPGAAHRRAAEMFAAAAAAEKATR